MNKIGVIGSRRRNEKEDLDLCRHAFLSIYHKGDIIVSGGCPKGGDKFAEIIAEELGIRDKMIIHYPNKSKLDPEKLKINPKWAYAEINFARNTLIAQDSDIILAVVSSDKKGGTEDTIKTAKKLGKIIFIVYGKGVKIIDDKEVLVVPNPSEQKLESDAFDIKEPIENFDPLDLSV